MVGQIVEYSISKKDPSGTGSITITASGYVLDKIDMRENEQSKFSTTGYLILNNEENKIYPIAYWRIQNLIK